MTVSNEVNDMDTQERPHGSQSGTSKIRATIRIYPLDPTIEAPLAELHFEDNNNAFKVAHQLVISELLFLDSEKCYPYGDTHYCYAWHNDSTIMTLHMNRL